MEWNPDLGFRRRETKIDRHDAEDLAANAFELDGFADDGRITGEALLPKGMTEEDVIVLASLVVTRRKGAAELRAHAKNHEKFGRDEGASEAEGLAVLREIKLVALGVRSDIEGLDLIAEGNEGAFGVSAGEANEILRLRERKRAKKDAVDEREDGGVGTDAKRESKDRDSGEGGVFAEHARAVAEIAEEGFEEWERALIADGFSGLLWAAEVDEGAAASFLRGHASAEIFFDGESEVRRDFSVEVAVELVAMKEGQEAEEELAEGVHEGAFTERKRKQEKRRRVATLARKSPPLHTKGGAPSR